MFHQDIIDRIRDLNLNFWILYVLGPWVFYLVSIEGPKILRELLQGMPYNVSRASEWGDKALIAYIFFSIHGVREEGLRNRVGDSIWWQSAVIAIWVIAGILLTKTGEKEGGDIFHNIFVLPILGILTFFFVPFFFSMSLENQIISVALWLIWIIGMAVDIVSGRLDQKGWILKHWNLEV